MHLFILHESLAQMSTLKKSLKMANVSKDCKLCIYQKKLGFLISQKMKAEIFLQ